MQFLFVLGSSLPKPVIIPIQREGKADERPVYVPAEDAGGSRSGSINKLESRPRNIKKAFDLHKMRDAAERSRSNSLLPSSRSQSVDLDMDSSNNSLEDDKTFQVTILVNESEKNTIVDMIHKAKSIISKKVEKVIGKKPKSGISNVEALQTVLESWVGREERKEREDKAEEEKYIRDQEKQVSDMLDRGVKAPVNYKPVPEVSVEEHGDEDTEDEITAFADMKVSRIGDDRYLQSPTWNPPSRGSLTPTLSNAENVPCPWGFRTDNELYPPKLRRPSSLYGADALAASSRPPSRQVSLSPSFLEHEEVSSVSSNADTIKPEQLQQEEEWEEEEEEEEPVRVCRPDSYLVPIGGVWKPDEDSVESEIVWGKVDEGNTAAADSAETPEDKGSAWVYLLPFYPI